MLRLYETVCLIADSDESLRERPTFLCCWRLLLNSCVSWAANKLTGKVTSAWKPSMKVHLISGLALSCLKTFYETLWPVCIDGRTGSFWGAIHLASNNLSVILWNRTCLVLFLSFVENLPSAFGAMVSCRGNVSLLPCKSFFPLFSSSFPNRIFLRWVNIMRKRELNEKETMDTGLW